jgi:hypothetical protein
MKATACFISSVLHDNTAISLRVRKAVHRDDGIMFPVGHQSSLFRLAS